MLLTLLVAAASAEWVEISQQHYRKPLRTYHFTTVAVHYEDTTKPWYNHSVTEYNWNRYLNRGDETTRGSIEDSEPEGVNYRPTKATVEDSALKGTVERVPHVGNVRKVQLNNSPVKSSNIKWKSDRDKNPYNFDEDDTNASDKPGYDNRIHSNSVQLQYSTTKVPFLTKDKDGMLFTEAPVDNKKQMHQFHNNTTINLPKYVFVTEEYTNNENDKRSDKYNYNRNTQQDQHVDTENSKETVKQTYSNKPNRFETKPQQNSLRYSENPETNDNYKTKDATTSPTYKQDNHNLKETLNIKSNKTFTKVDTIENLMKFMVVVADTISKNSRRSFNGKLRYLQELKNNILANIEDRIDATWPDDSAPAGPARRRSRAARAHADPRGHVQFPSSESALMTISFLTFAVFLIKLVLQVIQTYKNKTMMVAPLVVAAAGRAAFAHRKHN